MLSRKSSRRTRAARARPLSRVLPQLRRPRVAVVGAARARRAVGPHRGPGISPAASRRAGNPVLAPFRRRGGGLGAPDLRGGSRLDVRQAEGCEVQRTSETWPDALRRHAAGESKSNGLLSSGQQTRINYQSQDLEKQIKWEHKWADSLNKSNIRPGVTSQEPSQLDTLLFGVLQGDVKMTRSGSQISLLEMIKPVELKNRGEFLESYKAVWSVSFDRVELDKQKIAVNSKEETYNLIDKSGKTVGQAIFGLDDLQTVKKLQFLTQ